MKHLSLALVVINVLVAGEGIAAKSGPINSKAAAIAVAKQYTKGKCTPQTPCVYDAQREGKNWRVYVRFTMRNSPREPAFHYPGGDTTLYFDEQGALVRRFDGE